jgi:NDP-sugar pyrophosphorylase family protein
MNGDSFLEMDLHRFVRFHRQHKGFASMAVVKVDNANRYGTVHLDDQARVTAFMEKAGSELPGLINGGVYVLNRAVVGHIPEGAASLEKDVFPRLLSHGVYAMEQDGMFIDIGTPEDYARAQQLSDRLYEAALSQPQHDSEL